MITVPATTTNSVQETICTGTILAVTDKIHNTAQMDAQTTVAQTITITIIADITVQQDALETQFTGMTLVETSRT